MSVAHWTDYLPAHLKRMILTKSKECCIYREPSLIMNLSSGLIKDHFAFLQLQCCLKVWGEVAFASFTENPESYSVLTRAKSEATKACYTLITEIQVIFQGIKRLKIPISLNTNYSVIFKIYVYVKIYCHVKKFPPVQFLFYMYYELLFLLQVYSGNEKAEDFLNQLPEPPKKEMIRDAVEKLQWAGALDDDENLTPLGTRISVFTTHPLISKALVHSYMFKQVFF